MAGEGEGREFFQRDGAGGKDIFFFSIEIEARKTFFLRERIFLEIHTERIIFLEQRRDFWVFRRGKRKRFFFSGGAERSTQEGSHLNASKADFFL